MTAPNDADIVTVNGAYGGRLHCWTDGVHVIIRNDGTIRRGHGGQSWRMTLTADEATQLGRALLLCAARGETPCVF